MPATTLPPPVEYRPIAKQEVKATPFVAPANFSFSANQRELRHTATSAPQAENSETKKVAQIAPDPETLRLRELSPSVFKIENSPLAIVMVQDPQAPTARFFVGLATEPSKFAEIPLSSVGEIAWQNHRSIFGNGRDAQNNKMSLKVDNARVAFTRTTSRGAFSLQGEQLSVQEASALTSQITFVSNQAFANRQKAEQKAENAAQQFTNELLGSISDSKLGLQNQDRAKILQILDREYPNFTDLFGNRINSDQILRAAEHVAKLMGDDKTWGAIYQLCEGRENGLVKSLIQTTAATIQAKDAYQTQMTDFALGRSTSEQFAKAYGNVLLTSEVERHLTAPLREIRDYQQRSMLKAAGALFRSGEIEEANKVFQVLNSRHSDLDLRREIGQMKLRGEI